MSPVSNVERIILGHLGVGVGRQYHFFDFGLQAIISFVTLDSYDICDADNWSRFAAFLQLIYSVFLLSTICRHFALHRVGDIRNGGPQKRSKLDNRFRHSATIFYYFNLLFACGSTCHDMDSTHAGIIRPMILPPLYLFGNFGTPRRFTVPAYLRWKRTLLL